MKDRYDRNSVAVQLPCRKVCSNNDFSLDCCTFIFRTLGSRPIQVGIHWLRASSATSGVFPNAFSFLSLACMLRAFACSLVFLHACILFYFNHRDPHFKKIHTARSRFGATSTTSTVLQPTRSHPAFKGQRLVLPRFTPARNADLHSHASAKQESENDALSLQLLKFIYV